MPQADREIREVTDRFYAALNRLLGDEDPTDMFEAWSHADDVSAMQPDGGRFIGWEEVRGLLMNWSKAATKGFIRTEDREHRVLGDVALVTGWERGGGTLAGQPVRVDARATIVFRREGTSWKVVHHHVDVVNEIRELVRKSMSETGSHATPAATGSR